MPAALGEIRRVGHGGVKAVLGQDGADLPQVCLQNFNAGGEGIAADALLRRLVGQGLQLQPGDPAVRRAARQQECDIPAATAQVRNAYAATQGEEICHKDGIRAHAEAILRLEDPDPAV